MAREKDRQQQKYFRERKGIEYYNRAGVKADIKIARTGGGKGRGMGWGGEGEGGDESESSRGTWQFPNFGVPQVVLESKLRVI